MKLTQEQVQAVTFGAQEVVWLDGAYHFYRFTQRQRDVLYLHDPSEQNFDTTGIRLDLHTDATQAQITIDRAGKYEVLVNDLTVFCERLEQGQSFCISLEGADNRVTIVLPCHRHGSVKEVILEDATYLRPREHKCKLAFYGDSITQGWDSEKDSQSYAWLTTRFLDADSINFGVGGTTFIPELPEDYGFQPDAVFVALGTNDYGKDKTMAQIQADCAAYLEAIQRCYPNSKWFCITPIWRWNGTRLKEAGVLQDVRQQIDRIAREHDFTVIDGLSMVPQRLEYFADKGTHPNDLGFFVYASNLVKAITPYL